MPSPPRGRVGSTSGALYRVCTYDNATNCSHFPQQLVLEAMATSEPRIHSVWRAKHTDYSDLTDESSDSSTATSTAGTESITISEG